MANFIVLTEVGPLHRRFVIDADSVEYFLDRKGSTEIATSTNHMKYVVQESLDDILAELNQDKKTNVTVVTMAVTDASSLWSKDAEYTLAGVEMQADYLKTAHSYKGYTYLSSIYESFGMAWDPDMVNICLRPATGTLEFAFMITDERTIRVTIH